MTSAEFPVGCRVEIIRSAGGFLIVKREPRRGTVVGHASRGERAGQLRVRCDGKAYSEYLPPTHCRRIEESA